MNFTKKDFFAHKAMNYENEKARVSNVNSIANTILNEIHFKKSDHLVDFGSGTGLLLREIAPYVGKISAIDKSPSMNQALLSKKAEVDCEIDIYEIDLSEESLEIEVDGIISSMTIHHVKDIKSLFETFFTMLKNGGIIALSDLDVEDGSFHTEDTGVYHFGFCRDYFVKVAQEVGFKNLKIKDASIVSKPYGEYSTFLMTGIK